MTAKFARNNAASSKLLPGQVMEIRHKYKNEGWSQGALARAYGVSGNQIGRIVRRESWQNLPDLDEEAAMTERLIKVGREVNDAKARMEEEVARKREQEQRGDKLLNELLDSADTPPASPLDE